MKCTYPPAQFVLRESGFTLLELLIVLIVIGIAAGLTGLSIRNTRGLDLRTTTRDVSAVLRYARNHAVSEKKMYSFRIDQEKRVYSLSKKTDKDSEEIEDVGRPDIISKPIPERIEVKFIGMNEDQPTLDFFPQGNSSGGGIKVSNGRGKGFNIYVNRITGKVGIEEETY